MHPGVHAPVVTMPIRACADTYTSLYTGLYTGQVHDYKLARQSHGLPAAFVY